MNTKLIHFASEKYHYSPSLVLILIAHVVYEVYAEGNMDIGRILLHLYIPLHVVIQLA